jgi:hypothetical protein
MRRKIVAVTLFALLVPQARSQALDYEVFKTQVEPIFLQQRAGHARCYMCHGERSNNAFKLETLAPGANFWTDEQSRKNFAVVSRLVVAGKPEQSLLLLHPLAPEAGGSAYHSGGRQFENRDDAGWKTFARWVRGS